MALMRPKTTTVGLPAVAHSLNSDPATMALVDHINAWRVAAGILVRPGDNIQSAVNQCNDGDTITLLPGTHQLNYAVTVNKRIRIVGAGATIQCSGTVFDVTANDAEVYGLIIVRTGRVAGEGALRLAGVGNRARSCTIQSAASAGIRVEGDYCAVQDCKFLASPFAVVGDADVYWADNATFGICCATLWSRTAGTFALDYRAIDQMTEAANGVFAIINVR